MKKLNQYGEINALMLPFVITLVLFLGSASFAVWAFSGRQDYKNNVDQKIASAVVRAEDKQKQKDADTYAEAAKNPFTTYTGSATYGSVSLSYPKTYSAYVDDSGSASGGAAIDGYFHPRVVPSITNQKSVFALRMQLVNSEYSQLVSQYTAQAKQGKVTVAPFAAPKVPSAVGVRVDGQLDETKSGSIVLLPLRDKTLEISSQSNDYLGDFNKVLENLTFVP